MAHSKSLASLDPSCRYIVHPLGRQYQICIEEMLRHNIRGSIALRYPADDAKEILEMAHEHGIRIELDMRTSSSIDGTLALYAQARAISEDAVICLQANRPRTKQDLQQLLSDAPYVRLVKGAFFDGDVYARKEDIHGHFLELAQICMDNGAPLFIATHDRTLITDCIASASQRKAHIHFQLLYGQAPGLHKELIDAGYPVSDYVFCGSKIHMLPYFLRKAWSIVRNSMQR